MTRQVQAGIFGASGYTGAELVRLLSGHPNVAVKLLTADRKAVLSMDEVFPQFTGMNLPHLTKIERADLSTLDVLFTALPHGTTQEVIADAFKKNPKLKIIDLSADFRLSDPKAYATWYGHEHQALDLQKEAVFGLTEHYREQVKTARLVANPGCHSTTAILPVVPLLKADVIDTDNIVIDSKTGMSGAGRAAKEEMLFSEVSEGIHAYGVGKHRHTSELDQEYSKAAGKEVLASFTPHLAPMNRGIYATVYVRTKGDASPGDLHAALALAYKGEPFVQVLPFGHVPQSRHVRGSNHCQIGVVADRVHGRAIVLSTTDNLMKGAAGQAVQNFNLVFGLPEAAGLGTPAMFP